MKTSKFTIETIIICILFCFIVTPAQCQILKKIGSSSSKIQFSISAGALNVTPSAKESWYQEIIYQNIILKDSTTQLQVHHNANFKVKHEFDNKFGFFAGGNIHFAFTSKTAFRTGIGIQFDRFNYIGYSQFLNLGTPVDSILSPYAYAGLNSNTVLKTVYEPGYSNNFDAKTKYKSLYLSIPFILEYQTPLNISVISGVFLNTLAWSESNRLLIKIRQEIEQLPDGRIQSTSYRSLQMEKKKPAINLANITSGWQLGIQYKLNQLALEVLYGQTFLNTFIDNDKDLPYNYKTRNAEVRNIYFKVGAQYYL